MSQQSTVNSQQSEADEREVAIKVEKVSKTFKLPHEKNSSIKGSVVNVFNKKKGYELQKALDDVSFEVKKGEFFGIVGRNGSGKSTLLKLLAGIYSPTTGNIQVNGKLTPFIELGVGFNPELTGRENVYLNGALLGFNRKKMNSMYKDIVDFAEIEKFMDQKLKNYSSGMQVRLAFSIAVKAKSDILIFDEVLAVGDEAFQQKCLRIFEEYREEGQTVILVTHDMSSVRNLCTRAMLIDGGEIKYIGAVDKVADMYSKINSQASSAPKILQNNSSHKKNKVFNVKVKNNKHIYKPSEELLLDIDWSHNITNEEAVIGVAIIGSDGTYIFGSNTRGLELKRNKVKHAISLDLGPGSYAVNIAALDLKGSILHLSEGAYKFRIIDDGRLNVGGDVRLKYKYNIEK